MGYVFVGFYLSVYFFSFQFFPRENTSYFCQKLNTKWFEDKESNEQSI